jgi:hypothetical protein
MPLFAAATPLTPSPTDVSGEYVVRGGESVYKIANYDAMQPFFISIVSASNFWLFASSNGGLSCGRVSAESPVFPYYTVDKIHDEHPYTGPKTAIIVEKDGKSLLWEPFVFHPAVYKTTRNLYKNMLGNKLTYEEVNEDLGLTFSYQWATADSYGIVRECSLVNHSGAPVKAQVLDGVRNLVAANTNGWLQDCMSNLIDAYKWNELVDQQVGIFCLFAGQSDRAVPIESLKATTVWQRGLPDPQFLLSSTQVDAFLAGRPITPETLTRGKRGAFFVHSTVELAAGSEQKWLMVAEVEQTHGSISKLQAWLGSEKAIPAVIEADIAAGSLALKQIIGAADGFQCLEDAATVTHHYANVMFNTMRGGIYDKGYTIERKDLTTFLKQRNTAVAKRHEAFLAALPESLNYLEFLGKAQATEDPDLIRLSFEYVPITFSRRHGDPSRPWNKFAIQLKDAEGHPLLNYQGNWRDIFQNWEALTISFPYFFESIIAKFVNASTIDGYNPYVVNKADGIAWECPEPDHPHSNIGYWGDHQIIYLLKLLEWCRKFQPGLLEANCDKARFSYANVPYEIRPYPKIVEDAKDTIVFNTEKHTTLEALKATMGADARLLLDGKGAVVHVNLAEKLLVPLLAKASNFVVGGGIWLNTQRPEWNDANNAIVGFGLSMVTVYYMRRYTTFLTQLFGSLKETSVSISEEVAKWLADVAAVFAAHVSALKGSLSSKDRRTILDSVGEAASSYRVQVYEKGLSGTKAAVTVASVLSFLETLQRYIDHSIDVNHKEDGLYHAYNILVLGPGTADISNLYGMLEGQASALSSGLITSDKAVSMLKQLYASDMYRPDQHSFMLYPDRALKGFMERNHVPAGKEGHPAVKFCVEKQLKGILYPDTAGTLRWAPTLTNAADLKTAVEKSTEAGLKDHLAALLELYEEGFNHRAFTGRSGTMFGFEGLGCIYWHMVSKVLLAVQELAQDALDRGDAASKDLTKYYYEVRAGLGFNKSPAVYGAFPCDPYSHTPKHAGAQQPGMTGQVKEEVLTRFGELGLRVMDGTLQIQPRLLRKSEFLTAAKTFEFVSLTGALAHVPLKEGQLGFTYCQCPFVYTKGNHAKVVVHRGATEIPVDGDTLPKDLAALIFQRTGEVTRVDVVVNAADLLAF